MQGWAAFAFLLILVASTATGVAYGKRQATEMWMQRLEAERADHRAALDRRDRELSTALANQAAALTDRTAAAVRAASQRRARNDAITAKLYREQEARNESCNRPASPCIAAWLRRLHDAERGNSDRLRPATPGASGGATPPLAGASSAAH